MIAQNNGVAIWPETLADAAEPLEILLTLARIEGKLDILRITLDACAKVVAEPSAA